MPSLRSARVRTRQAGDTIVEVMIAVVVVSSLLVGAFTVTTHNLTDVRDSEEHSEALQLLQGQVELLRNDAPIAGTVPNTLPTSLTTAFCLVGSTYKLVSSGGCQAGSNNLYKLSIICASFVACTGPSTTQTTTFTLSATWPALNGGNDSVFLTYKVLVS